MDIVHPSHAKYKRMLVEQKSSDNVRDVCNCARCRHYADERDSIRRALARIESPLKRIEQRSSNRGDDARYTPISRFGE